MLYPVENKVIYKMGSGDRGAVTPQYPHDGTVEKEIDTSTNHITEIRPTDKH